MNEMEKVKNEKKKASSEIKEAVAEKQANTVGISLSLPYVERVLVILTITLKPIYNGKSISWLPV